MLDSLTDKKNEGNQRISLTNAENSSILEIRCFNCNRLLCTGHIQEGLIIIKCGKCGKLITIGAQNTTSATSNKTTTSKIKI